MGARNYYIILMIARFIRELLLFFIRSSGVSDEGNNIEFDPFTQYLTVV